MPASSWFWILVLVVIIGSVYFGWQERRYGLIGLFVALALVLVGWSQFGPPIK